MPKNMTLKYKSAYKYFLDMFILVCHFGAGLSEIVGTSVEKNYKNKQHDLLYSKHRIN